MAVALPYTRLPEVDNPGEVFHTTNFRIVQQKNAAIFSLPFENQLENEVNLDNCFR